ncbi:hypothetical protein PF006_g21981 [Phytophthora fragariae]|uniref:RxLR effector protein n=1 Tax=Phytophthora fragariae TaxID=53985 RepID=A0A6A3RUE0_9STRA|nr:hypothetical protein PF006_g21981 [Phytophthora fragariae]
MKFAAFAIVAMANVVAGADPMPTALPPSKALEVAQSVSAPEGVEFTGSIEKIEQPTDATEIINALQTHDDADGDKKEEFGSAQRAKVSRHGAALECCGCRSRLRRGSWSVN